MSLERNTAGHFPEIAPTAYIHPTATVIGKVCIGDLAWIGPHAVLRADEAGPHGTIEPIVVGDRANVQDGVVIHAVGGTGVNIGPRTSVAHAAVIHGPCRLGADCFVGFHSIVFRAILDDGAMVMHHALVENAFVAKRLLVPSMTAVLCDKDAARLAPVSEEMAAFARRVLDANVRLAEFACEKRLCG